MFLESTATVSGPVHHADTGPLAVKCLRGKQATYTCRLHASKRRPTAGPAGASRGDAPRLQGSRAKEL